MVRVTALLGVLLLVVGVMPATAAAVESGGTWQRWPGASTARTVDVRAAFGPDMSGLAYVAGASPGADRLWAVRNDGRLFRLVASGGVWRAEAKDGWARGKVLAFPDGRRPDAEALVMRGRYAYVGTERDGRNVSRPSVVRYDVAAAGGTLTATHEWNLSAYYPGIRPNLGIEALGFVPNGFLVEHGFVTDDGRAFDPADHPGQHGGGVFMVAVEAPGLRDHVDAYVLSNDGTSTRVARLPHPLAVVTELEFEPDTGRLWAHCDDFCDGRSVVLELGGSGRWRTAARYARIAGLPNQNFEGLAITPDSRCVDGRKPVFFSNDSNNSGHALWRGMIDCKGGPPPRGSVRAVVSPVQAGRKAKVRVRVSRADGRPAAGQITVRVANRRRTARLVDGAAVVAVGRFKRTGPRKVTVEHGAVGRTTALLRVLKARIRLTPVRPRLVARPGARLRVPAKARSNGLKLGGKVRVRVGQRWVKHRVVRLQGRLVVRITAPRRKGAVRVQVRYAGGKHTTAARATYRLQVR